VSERLARAAGGTRFIFVSLLEPTKHRSGAGCSRLNTAPRQLLIAVKHR